MNHAPDRVRARWDPAAEARTSPRRPSGERYIAWASLLIAVGVALLLVQVLDLSLAGALWPLYILAFGGAMMLLAFTAARGLGEPLVALGSVSLAVGGLLLFQSVSGYWVSWVYAWALVAPASIGAGMWLWGRANHRADLCSTGAAMARVGIVLFIVLGALFELVINVGGARPARIAWAVALVVVGTLWMGRSLWRRGRTR